MLTYGGWGFRGWGLGLLRLGFSADRVWGLWCRAFWGFWGWGSIYKHRRINLGKKPRLQTTNNPIAWVFKPRESKIHRRRIKRQSVGIGKICKQLNTGQKD